MVLEKIKEGDLIDLPTLGKVLDEMINRGVRGFSVDGLFSDFFWDFKKKEKILEAPIKVLETETKGEEFAYRLKAEFPEELRGEDQEILKSRIRDAFLRCGVCKHGNLPEIMEKLRAHDDVILSPDTNIILDCVISSVMWDEIRSAELPNWVLIAVPKLVMAEIEAKAYRKITKFRHPRLGWPPYDGRVGQRGLQEILKIDTDVTLRGLSIMTIGKLPEVYDTIKSEGGPRMDSEIRTQFRDFLRTIDFHKGCFFLTQDRVNAMMAGAEGLNGLYLQKPGWGDIVQGTIRGTFPHILYELALTFGEITVNGVGEFNPSFSLSIFWPAKHVQHWEESRAKVTSLKGV